MTSDLTELLGDLRKIYEELYCTHNEDLALSALAAASHLERLQMYALEWVRVQDGLPDFDDYVLWRTRDYNYFVEALDKDGDMVDTTWATHWTRFKGPSDA